MNNIIKKQFGCLTIACLVLACATTSLAQTNFTSGSDGSYGPLIVVTNTTLMLPANGVFNCTTIIISNGATLNFIKNPLNTPVYLLATSNVIISGTIDVSGRNGIQGLAGTGGPGGFDGGFPAASSQDTPGDGFGPGGGDGGNLCSVSAGSFGTIGSHSSANTYGNILLMPLIGGSGGGGQTGNPGVGGGGGGGGMLIASSISIQINSGGAILANGGSTPYAGCNYGSGSGGGVRLVSPVATGNGSIQALGGPLGGNGIIRIDAADTSGLNFSFSGKTRVGQNMVVFPPGNPVLYIVQAAGMAIPTNTSSLVTVNLPPGAATNQNVMLQANNFTNTVLLRVAVTPEQAASAVFGSQLYPTNGNPAFITIPVVLPAGQVSHITAWTE